MFFGIIRKSDVSYWVTSNLIWKKPPNALFSVFSFLREKATAVFSFHTCESTVLYRAFFMQFYWRFYMGTINPRKEKNKEQVSLGHKNWMDGVSYDISDPVKQLRIVASSCFFNEPMYYHEDSKENQTLRNRMNLEMSAPKVVSAQDKYLDDTLKGTISIPNYHNYSSALLMETAIDAALNSDPEATLQEAVRLRNEENIRTTPQVIMVRAAHNEKVKGTQLISTYAPQILKRTDEASVQLAYQVRVFGKNIPTSLKKAWKKFLEARSEYDLAKYRMDNRSFKTVDVVNLVHAFSPEIDKLMKGQLKLSVEDTFEALISKNGSNKESWTSAIDLMGHMALLRNLRNLHKSGVSPELYLPKLTATAENGKQLPFRYFSAYEQLKNESGIQGKILDAVEECLKISIGQLPKFEGKVMSLCDNSGSAQGTATSSMGTMKVNHIANLTAVLTGMAADDGYIGVFGDNLEVRPVRKGASVFDQVDAANKLGLGIGGSTENGIWMFFNKAIKNKEHWDHIFVYSDMQAGHGGLYGKNPSEYGDYIWNDGSGHGYGVQAYIDVAKLIKTYREQVNPDVKVYLVQVAGYRDTLVPEFYDKSYILGGWGDGILRFAHAMSTLDEKPVLQSSEKSRKEPVISYKKSRIKIK